MALRNRLSERASFRTKVLVPVVAVMVLLVAATVFIVSRLLTRQFQIEAQNTLTTADRIFEQLQSIRSHDLLLRFHGLVNQPVYAAFSTADAPTLRGPLQKLLDTEEDLAIVLYSTNAQGVVASRERDTDISAKAFTAAAAPAIKRALDERETVDTICVGKHLYAVISIPVYDEYNAPAGALTLGSEIGDADAHKFSQLTDSQIVLLAGGQAVASTFSDQDANEKVTALFNESLSARANGSRSVKQVPLAGGHYFYTAGNFESLSGDKSLGYVLLSSYENSLQVLQSTQQVLLGVSLGTILCGAAIVLILVSKITQPLRELRDSAEAVGRGDFSRRVQPRSKDECGELAVVFNQMTENIQRSRAELEKALETLKSTQAQLIQSEKLSAVGEFVAGVAHELNNPLSTVMGYSELIKDMDVDAKYRRQLESIFKSAQRCQKIVQSLLSFARRQKPERKPVPVNVLIEAVLEIVAYPLRTSNIEVITQLDPALPPALADGHQIQQVLLNIVNNARQAIEAHQPAGKIKITTEERAPRIRITIQDDGPGISQENLSRIFDPFFTTKDVGQGTGLGLSLCYGIIKEHGGDIKATSRPGEGAAFVIELPAACDAVRSADESASPFPNNVNTDEGAGKRVLVIDDEEMILEMINEGLGRNGYHVETVANGETALHRLRQNHYDVALCDWKIPGLSGRQIYEQLSATNPELCRRIIFITGDVINDRMREFLEAEKRPCLSKPFAFADLRAAIRAVFETKE